MKAIQLRQPGGLDNLEQTTVSDPGKPGRGEVRVRVHASSLNFHDLSVVLGHMPSDDGRIPMSDGAGVVEAVGDGVTEFKPGDQVVSTFFPQWSGDEPAIDNFSTTPGDGIDGFACEYVVRPVNAFTPIPKNYSLSEAATLTTAGLTAWRALIVNGGLKAGDTVLVLGTGGVSIFALQLAKAMGATVIATSSSNDKLKRVQELGADHVINYKETPEWGKKVQQLTDGRGVDHTVEVGGPGTLGQSIQATRIGGHIALIGVLTGASGDVPTAALMARQQRLQGLIVGSRQHQLDMIRALESTGIKPVIDQTFALDEISSAFSLQQEGGHFGKIVLEF
ncbi:zinc-dependent alcohol dehydrogenase family protein [Aliidiomarina sp. Khilg15.8]